MLIVDLKTKVFLMFLFAVLKPIPTLSSSYYHKMATKKTTTTPACAEIVTFRLKEGVTPSQFRAFALETTAVLKEFGGYLSRRLTINAAEEEDSNMRTWTDYILWIDMDTALKAADAVPKDPRFANFGNAIDLESVTMRHELVELQWENED
jgi:hypothetical protein